MVHSGTSARLKLLCVFGLWAAGAFPLKAADYGDLFRSAALHSQRGEFEQALADYQAALALRPDAPEALNNAAVMLYQLHRYGEAFQLASKIWKTHPELPSAALVTGMSAVQTDRPQQSIAPLTALLAKDPVNRDALLALASAYLALADLPNAIRTYATELHQQPGDVTAWYGMGICYERQAEAASAHLAHLPGGRNFSKLLLAHYLQSAGDDKLAAEAFGESVPDPASPSTQAQAEYDAARAAAAQAQSAFEHLLAIAPHSWQANVFLGDVARQHGDLLGAIAHYKDALTQQPGSTAALLGLGTAYWELGDFAQASNYLEATRRANPRGAQALFELGNIAIRQHREADAIPLLKDYLAVQPDALAAHADLGRAYLHLGDYEAAASELQKAAASDDRGDVHYQLSVALKKLGRLREAGIALQESTAIRQAELQREQQRHATETRNH